ncbi:cyclase [Mycobacteriaceae bacterium 1482268.1]|nr:cyclase [Mycobacteriaceae bacterium 1482268.1]
MRLQRRVVIDADRDTIWKHVSDPSRYPEFMSNLERWDNLSEGPAGVGSRYTGHWKIGSVPVGGVIEVVEFDDGRDLAWVGITGITQRGRFRLRDCPDGKTKVSFRMTYEAPGGLLGLIADRVAARQVGRTMTETLENLRSLTES